MPPWTKKDIPSQVGKTVIVTGATGGLGYETALYFAEAGATVIVAGRNESKGQVALENIKSVCPDANVQFGKLDLYSLASVTEFCTWFNSNYQILDVLINNAATFTETKETTQDGFQMMMGTNHLSHFALTAQLLPALRRSPQARVVSIASLAAYIGKIDFDDFQREKSSNGLKDYGATKLANLLFTFELQRRSDAGGFGLIANAAHPGRSQTEGVAKVQANRSSVYKWISSKTSHSAAEGALSTMYAATAPEAGKAGYYGPQNWFGAIGPPGIAGIPSAAKDIDVAKKLWELSESLTGVTWPTN